MAVSTKHPLYIAMAPKWSACLDWYEGTDAVKRAGETYLPSTTGQRIDGHPAEGTEGRAAYDAYKTRAYVPDLYAEAVEAIIGIMHREPPTVKLPAKLAEMASSASLLGESLEMVLRRINTQQLITGRLGLLGDLRRDDDGTVRPVVAIYNDLSISNWDDTADNDDDINVRLVVLDETHHEMDNDLNWVIKEEYRILALTDDEGRLSRDGTYSVASVEDGQKLSPDLFSVPNFMGTTIPFIPFVFVNSSDLSPSPSKPPLQGLLDLCILIYQGEANYRQQLFMQGQDTLVRIGHISDGENKSVRTGAGAMIDVPMGGDAKYIGVSSQGLPEQRQALEADYRRAATKAGQFADATSRAKESGDALRIRMAAQTATMPAIAQAGAEGLQTVLRHIARFVGANPDEVEVVPNLKFTESDLNGQTLVQLLQAKGLGAPLSDKSIHEYARRQGFTSTEFEEELKQILEEVENTPALPKVPSPAEEDLAEAEEDEQGNEDS